MMAGDEHTQTVLWDDGVEITVRWALIDGRRAVVGLDIQTDREIDQRLLRSVTIARLREVTRPPMPRPESDGADVLRAYAESVRTMTTTGHPRRRAPTTGRDFLAIVAHHYRAGYHAGRTDTARYVEEQLKAEGVLTAGESGARDRVRKWIQRTREAGLLPPAGQPPVPV